MTTTTRIYILALLTVSAVGCEEYIPTPEKLRLSSNPSRAFIVDERDIYGIYGYSDVDSAIYGYVTQANDEKSFWEAVDRQATEQGWEFVTSPDAYRRYCRIRSRSGSQGIDHSVEEVRIALKADSMKAFIAWVQTEPPDKPTSFPTDGPEGRFAEDVVWPKFAEQIAADANP